jgi:hypothetical protein
LVLEKKLPVEISAEENTQSLIEYETFMATPKRIGHDRRGHPTYVRSIDGDELFIDVNKQITRIARGRKIKENITLSERVLDDDLSEVAKLFTEWWRDRN